MKVNMKKDEISFSVVMPVYNAERYLAAAIESVLRQTWTDFEFIIVNDGSSDESESIIRSYAQRDTRIKAINQKNSGPGSAMNAGVQEANATWIVVMHGDDIMLPNRLESIYSYLSQCTENVGIVTSAVELIASDSRVIGRATPELPRVPFYLDESNQQYIVGGLHHPAISIAVLNRVGGYSDSCRVNEDVDLYNRIVESGYGIQILSEKLMQYRIHGEAATTTRAFELLVHWRYLKQCIRRRRKNLPEPSWEEFLAERTRRGMWTRWSEYRKDAGKVNWRRAASALSGQQYIMFVVLLLIALFYSPSFCFKRLRSRTQRPHE